MSILKVTDIKAADGTSALSIADGTGKVTFPSNIVLSSGIDFGTSTGGSGAVTGGVLDDYEEGTFTLTGKSSGGTTLFTHYNQPYQKIGNRCFVEIYLNNSTGTNATKFEGLPFTASGDHWAPNSQTLSRVVTINNGNDFITWGTASNAGQIMRMQISYQTA